jgi:hypothetical protein
MDKYIHKYMEWDITTTLHRLCVLGCEAATIWRILPINNISLVTQHAMFNIDLSLA